MTTFTADQIANGQTIIGVVKSLGLSPQDTTIAEDDAIEGGLAESGLVNVGYGDYPASMGGQMSSSRGVFQQIAAWGPETAREDVATATRMFLTGGQGGQTGLTQVPNWDQIPGPQAVQAVQQSEFSDGSNYAAQQSAALDFLNQYGGVAAPVTGSAATSPAAGTATAAPASYTTTQPASWLSNLLGVTGIAQGVEEFAAEAIFVVAGLGLVTLGIWRVSAPVRSKLPAMPIPL